MPDNVTSYGNNVMSRVRKTTMSDVWNSYRRRRTAFVLSLFAVPALGLCGTAIDIAVSNTAETFGKIGAGLGLAAFAISGIALTVWRCPRCGLPFCCRWWMSNIFAGKCVHCELDKWAEPEQ